MCFLISCSVTLAFILFMTILINPPAFFFFMDNLPWTLKYQPQSLKSFSLHATQIQQMQNFIETFKKQKKKAMLIHGPTGCGKTVAVHALAHDSNLELIEMNASDFRNKEGVLSIIGTASKQRSLFSSGKIILVDEVDGLSGNQDRGGISAIEEVRSEEHTSELQSQR